MALIAAIGGGVLLGQFYSIARFSDEKVGDLYSLIKEWQTLITGFFAVIGVFIATSPVYKQLSELQFQSGVMRYDLHRLYIDDLDAELKQMQAAASSIRSIGRIISDTRELLMGTHPEMLIHQEFDKALSAAKIVLNALANSDTAAAIAGGADPRYGNLASSVEVLMEQVSNLVELMTDMRFDHQSVAFAQKKVDKIVLEVAEPIANIENFIWWRSGEIRVEANVLRSQRRFIFKTTKGS